LKTVGPGTVEIINRRIVMDGNEYIVGLVSALIGAAIVASFIAAFGILIFVVSL
jgi:hypothetical protein